MDERLEKALQTANFMASLNLTRKASFEEFNQNLNFYQDGCSFTANLDIIAKLTGIMQHTNTAIILDNNNIPVEIKDVKAFVDRCMAIYTEQSEKYLAKYQNIKKQRNIGGLISL